MGKSAAVWKVNSQQGIVGTLREPQPCRREGSFKELLHWKEKIVAVEKIPCSQILTYTILSLF